MNYLSVLFLLWVILVFSNFLNLRFKIKFNETFLVSISILISTCFILYQTDYYFSVFSLQYALIYFVLISLFILPYLLKNFSKTDLKLNLEFILIFILIFLLSKDRYYLDQDEVSYWGMALKSLAFGEYSFDHHPQGLNVFRYLLKNSRFDEGLTIFTNNLILISGFYYLFYDRKLLILEKILLFSIFFLLLNNLSFGLVSAYADPVLAIFYGCLLKKLFTFFKDKNIKIEFSIIIVFLTLFLIKRSSIIYGTYILAIFSGLYLIDRYKNNKGQFFSFTLIFAILLFAIYKVFFPIILENFDLGLVYNTSPLSYINIINEKFFHFLFTPIYFSNFGVTLNTILEIFFSPKYKILEIQIPLVTYIIFLFPFIFFNFKYKSFFFISAILFIFTHMFIILVFKSYFENLHVSALPRYIGIILISKYLFFIYVVTTNYKLVYKNYFLLFLFLCFALVTPKKTLGFFVSDKIYYSDSSNRNYKENRIKISKLRNINDNYQDIFIIHQEGFSDFTDEYVSGEHTFYQNIITYELFPKRPIFIELNNFLEMKNNLNFDKNFLILFDLPIAANDVINVDNNNILKIDTYKKNEN